LLRKLISLIVVVLVPASLSLSCSALPYSLEVNNLINGLRYQLGEPITLEARVRYNDGQPVVGLIVEFIEQAEAVQLVKTSLLNGVAGVATNTTGDASITFSLLYECKYLPFRNSATTTPNTSVDRCAGNRERPRS